MKQGPFPHRRFCCPRGSSGTTGPSATLPAGTRLHGITAYTRPSLPEHQPAGPGPGRASPVRLPLRPLAREKLTGRQASLHATDRSLARPRGTLDAGLQRRAFPPDAASLLPGALALTGTGLPPAGGCELMFGSDHLKASPPNLWAHDGAFMECHEEGPPGRRHSPVTNPIGKEARDEVCRDRLGVSDDAVVRTRPRRRDRRRGAVRR